MGILGLFGKMVQAEEFIDRITPKVSLDTFLESVSDLLDQEIMQVEQEEGLFFLGGKMHFSLTTDERTILMDAEMFFQNYAGEYQKMDKHGEYLVSMLKWETCDEFLEQISEQGEVVIEINKP